MRRLLKVMVPSGMEWVILLEHHSQQTDVYSVQISQNYLTVWHYFFPFISHILQSSLRIRIYFVGRFSFIFSFNMFSRCSKKWCWVQGNTHILLRSITRGRYRNCLYLRTLRASPVAQKWRIHLQSRRCRRQRFDPCGERSSGGDHGSPLQYSCQENLMDRGAWWATVPRVAKSWTSWKQLSMHTRGLSNECWCFKCPQERADSLGWETTKKNISEW